MLAGLRPHSLLVDALLTMQEQTGAHVALIGEFLDTPIPRIRTVCCVQSGQRIDDFSFPIAGDPLQAITEGQIVSILDSIRGQDTRATSIGNNRNVVALHPDAVPQVLAAEGPHGQQRGGHADHAGQHGSPRRDRPLLAGCRNHPRSRLAAADTLHCSYA
ncbi:MAG TPA: hypothetical protein PLW86_19800 [Rhodocyclaceae bacterium]|nr:hypothetical protein [Rhodocyclaceae bacterium]